jgi:hypothetical protein
MPIWVMMILMVIVGLFGGYSDVNAFHSIMNSCVIIDERCKWKKIE